VTDGVAGDPVGPLDPQRRAESWRRFADACEDRSPLHARFARGIAGDLRVADLLRAAPTPELGHPTLLFAAVHDLLLQGFDAPELRSHYPSLAGASEPPAHDPWPAFRAFCLDHRGALEHTIATRRTQTNEVGRSTLLLLALAAIARETIRPLALLDLGTSAGLALRLDRYHHDLGRAGSVGDPNATVHLRCEVSGPVPPVTMPPLGWRTGLDATPVDLADPAARRWLEACVWPEQTDRLERLRAALTTAARWPVELHQGDAVADLARVAAGAPAGSHLVVSHTWVLAYLSEAQRAALEHVLDDLGATRDLDRIGMEGPSTLPGGDASDPTAPSLLLRSRWRDGVRTDQVLADVDDHGRWARWRG
jgi:hypothetical protein